MYQLIITIATNELISDASDCSIPLIAGTDERVEIPAPIGQPCVLYPTGSQVGEQFVRNLKQRQLLWQQLKYYFWERVQMLSMYKYIHHWFQNFIHALI